MKKPCLRTVLLFVATAYFSTAAAHARNLTLEERVAAQQAVERAYYSHQLGVTRSFGEAVTDEVVTKKVRDYLKQSVALDRLWRTPVTAEALRAETERIAQDTRMPGRLAELFSVLGNDSLLVQECLARPALVDRLVRSFFSTDQNIHAATRAESEVLRQRLVDGELSPWSDEPHRHVREIDPSAEVEEFTTALPIGEIGPISEESESFVFQVVLAREVTQTRIALYRVAKISWDEWWQSVEATFGEADAPTVAEPLAALPTPGFQPGQVQPDSVSSEAVSPRCLPENAWDTSLMRDLPEPRSGHVAVWTGSEMIVWGGKGSTGSLVNTGARYNPLTDTWKRTSVSGAPGSLGSTTAFWTGNVMVVVGNPCTATGCTVGVVGARYNPTSDSWSPISLTGAPSTVTLFSTTWTGSEVVVWGGLDFRTFPPATPFTNTGARYDPARDVWTPMSTVNAPSPRMGAVVVGIGSQVIVCDGSTFVGSLRDGARYNLQTDTWTPMAPLPTFLGSFPGQDRVVVWTGKLILAWTGSGGFRYDPAGNFWSPISTTNAPFPPSRVGTRERGPARR